MSAELSAKRGIGSSWLEHAVFGLDRWLRRRQGIYEYTTHPACLFRIERCPADEHIALSDGTHVRPGDPVLKLHLWNEHVPPMGQRGPTVAWARQTCRGLEISLQELARYLSQRAELHEVAALYGDMHLGTAQTQRLMRVIGRCGFEAQPDRELGLRGTLQRVGETILVLMLILVTNPVALRRTVLRHHCKRVFLSRRILERFYGPKAAAERAAGRRSAFRH